MRVIWPNELDGSHGYSGPDSGSDAAGPSATSSSEPAILPFPGSRQQVADVSQPNGIRPDEQSPAERARLISRNSLCQHCHKRLVSLILAEDGRRDGSGDFVPGTQTLIGFRCECCQSEWPARLSVKGRPALAVVSAGE